MTWETEGFNLIKDFFENAASSGHLGHAYIFSGQEMIGKRTFALELATKINKSKNIAAAMADVLAIDPSSSESGESIPIEQVRQAKNFLSLSAYEGPYKFVIINDADKMTVESQNAFLKILEEPSDASVIILVTAYPEMLLSTVGSRCQEIKFPNHSKIIIKAALLKEKTQEEKADFLSEFANGRLGLALKVAREDLYSQIKDHLSEFAEIKKSSLAERLKRAQKLSDVETGVIREKLLYWMLYLRMHITAHDGSKALKGLIELNYLLGQPQYNRRLMLENFMLRL